MVKTQTVEQELLEALEAKPKKASETPQDYRARLIRAANEMDEGEWKKLSIGTQRWVNNGVEAIQDKKEIDDFPDSEPTGEEDADAEEAEKPSKKSRAADPDEDEEEDPKPKAKEGPSPKKVADPEKEGTKEKPATKKPPVKRDPEDSDTRPKKKGGAGRTFRTFLIQHPEEPIPDLVKRVEKAGYQISLSTVTTIYYETKQTLEILDDLGMLKSAK